MPEEPNQLAPPSIDHAQEEVDGLRLLSRSPHPYHRQNFELLHPSDTLTTPAPSAPRRRPADHSDPSGSHLHPLDAFTKESTPTSDSGTEADDEHFLKGLPAPRAKPHKGLRGRNEALSGTSTPLFSPALLEEEGRRLPIALKKDVFEADKRANAERTRRRKELARRSTELLLLILLCCTLLSRPEVLSYIKLWKKELLTQLAIISGLLLLYPLRLVIWAYRKRIPSRWVPIAVPTTFDPAPILYPPVIPLLVSLLLAAHTEGVILPNLVLSICGIPKALIPAARSDESYNVVHWILSCIPIFITEYDTSAGTSSVMAPETATLLYPLHETLCLVLHYLTTTSLLPAELQLLAISLVGMLFLAFSPQAVILKALLWGGGTGILVCCGPVIRWGITLARVPKWRFRRLPAGSKRQSPFRALIGLMSLRKVKYELLGSAAEESAIETGNSSDEHDGGGHRASLDSNSGVATGRVLSGVDGINGIEIISSSPSEDKPDIRFNVANVFQASPLRRQTVPLTDKSPPVRLKTHTPSGRKKRSASTSVRAFFSFTQAQAAQRRWIYAGYLYISVAAIVLIGIREYIGRLALGGEEPIGWALGYVFGDLAGFRLEVVKAGLERWICLPTRFDDDDLLHAQSCPLGWVEHLRRASFGEANTRLILSAYWLGILIMGLAVVFQLSPIYEVDTRRKVFHFMMVAMFLPATFVDPTYAALALALILAIFLLLDLLRASQLPPLSKPIASFLTPYVDGRDLRGPVVISHIFLLIGCAIPLWLSLAALPRTGSGYLKGWEVPSRDASMVSGVVCVGLGDAAASLIGRRWGHHKWLWGGGKSLEGSVAFASAVFLGLMAAAFWLRVGGWPVTDESTIGLWAWAWGRSARNAGVCASVASLTEAVLTGGNDNVVVPVILWTCVKSLGV